MFPVLTPRVPAQQLPRQRSLPALHSFCLAFHSPTTSNPPTRRPKRTTDSWFLRKSQSPLQALIAASRRETLERVLQRSDTKALLQEMVEARRPAGWSRTSWLRPSAN